MINNITEIGPRAVGIHHIKPIIKVGDMVFVNWANGQCYKGVIREKLRKNWSVEIQDENWNHRTNHASVPDYALVKRNFS